MRRVANRWIWGTALLLIGVGFFLNALGIPGVRDLVVQWWPLVFVVIGLGDLLTGNPFNGVFWCLLGVVVSLFTSGTVSYSGNLWSILWPLALALIGLRLLLRPLLGKRARLENRHFADSSAVFGGTEKRVDSQEFKGSTVNAIFGGATLDLRDARIAEEGAVIDVSVVFGGVEIVVPPEHRSRPRSPPSSAA